MIFDNCGRKTQSKVYSDVAKLGVQQSLAKAYIVMIVDVTIPVHDSKLFLANNETKDSLIFCLANKVLQLKFQ